MNAFQDGSKNGFECGSGMSDSLSMVRLLGAFDRVLHLPVGASVEDLSLEDASSQFRVLFFDLYQATSAAFEAPVSFALADWWLFSTSGCHLCQKAEAVLQQVQGVFGFGYVVFDLADFASVPVWVPFFERGADKLPFVVGNVGAMKYPFSVVDLQGLL